MHSGFSTTRTHVVVSPARRGANPEGIFVDLGFAHFALKEMQPSVANTFTEYGEREMP